MGTWGGSFIVPTSIVNFYSDGNVQSPQVLPGAYDGYGGKSFLSGALTADTYKELLSVTGGGAISYCTVSVEDTTPRTIGLKVVIDGTTVFDAVSSTINVQARGLVAIGVHDSYIITIGVQPQSFAFNTSLSISVKSSLSETDKVRLSVAYVTM